MGRTRYERVLSTRTARLRLAVGRSYWRQITRRRHLGYHRNKGAGTWRAREYEGDGRYRAGSLGQADDLTEADGTTVLTYDQALEKARAWFEGHRRKRTAGPYTVRKAVEDYHRFLVSEGSPSAESVRSLQRAHLERRVEVKTRPQEGDLVQLEEGGDWLSWEKSMARRMARGVRRPLAAIEVRKLESQMIRDWRHSIVKDGRAWITSNRMLGALKAALNLAFEQREALVPSDLAWRRVKAKRVPRKKIIWYSVEESRRIIEACAPDFRPIAFGSVITGARWAECIRLDVGDYEPIRGQPLLRITVTKSGYSREVFLDQQGDLFFDQLTQGRSAEEPMFLAAIHTGATFAYFDHRGRASVQVMQQFRKLFGAYETAPTSSLPAHLLRELCKLTGLSREEALTEAYRRWRSHSQKDRFDAAVKKAGVHRPKQGFHDFRRTYASLLVSAGVSLKAVADQLGHRDTRMVELHYGELAKSVRAVAVQRRMPHFGLEEGPRPTGPKELAPAEVDDICAPALPVTTTTGSLEHSQDVLLSYVLT